MSLFFLETHGMALLSGFAMTIWIVVLSIGLGCLLAFPLCYLRMRPNAVIRGGVWAYTSFFRGTPLMAQTFLVYYGSGDLRPYLETLGMWWIFQDSLTCVLFVFVLNSSAYQTEIFRQAVREVGKGQWEAGESLGLNKWAIFWTIIRPQAFVCALRPYSNEIILMIKASAIASVVTVMDLMATTKLIFSRTFDFQVYFWACLMYLGLIEVVGRLWNILERRALRFRSF